MSSVIGIGFVYDNCNNFDLTDTIFKIVQFLLEGKGSPNRILYSIDENGGKWVELHPTEGNLKRLVNMVISYFYVQIDMKCRLFEHDNINVILRIENKKSSNCCGILLDINESDLLGINLSDQQLLSLDNQIISFISQIHQISRFDYAFCDNDAEIDYSCSEIRAMTAYPYSINILSNVDGSLNIIKNKWNIDGLTTRNLF